jgi:hypothetical protein
MNAINITPEPTESPRPPECILFSFAMSGAKLNHPTHELIARLFQETLERPLEAEGLIYELSWPPVLKDMGTHLDRMTQVGKAAMESVESSELEKISLEAIDRSFKEQNVRLFSGRPWSVHPIGGTIAGVLFVTDAMRAFPIIEAELKRLAFLEWAQIGSYDAGNNIIHSYFPKNTKLHFGAHLFNTLKQFGIIPPSPPTLQ